VEIKLGKVKIRNLVFVTNGGHSRSFHVAYGSPLR